MCDRSKTHIQALKLNSKSRANLRLPVPPLHVSSITQWDPFIYSTMQVKFKPICSRLIIISAGKTDNVPWMLA